MAITNVDSPYVTLDAGVPTVVVNGATGTGTGAAQVFTVQPRPDGSARTVSFQAIPSGTFTALTANLEASSNGGTTWNTYASGGALDFKATPSQTISNLVAGLVYRLNIATFTGGTSVVINATAS
jgi:hypothetical protein